MRTGTSCWMFGEGPYILNRSLPQASRKRHFLIVVRLLALIGLVAAFNSCCQTAKVKGRWQCGLVVISIYDDGVASVSGARAAWSTIGPEAIRLEFEEKGEAGVAELTVTSKSENGLRTAIFNLGGLKTNCSELPQEEGK